MKNYVILLLLTFGLFACAGESKLPSGTTSDTQLETTPSVVISEQNTPSENTSDTSTPETVVVEDNDPEAIYEAPEVEIVNETPAPYDTPEEFLSDAAKEKNKHEKKEKKQKKEKKEKKHQHGKNKENH